MLSCGISLHVRHAFVILSGGEAGAIEWLNCREPGSTVLKPFQS